MQNKFGDDAIIAKMLSSYTMFLLKNGWFLCVLKLKQTLIHVHKLNFLCVF